MLISGNFAELLRPGLQQIFDTLAGRPDPVRDTLFNVIPSSMAWEEYEGMGTVGLVPPWSGQVEYEDFDAYYKKTIRNFLLVKGISVEKTLLEDDQYGKIRQRATGLGETFATTKEHDAVQVFINAFTDSGKNRMGDSVAGADAVGLCSTAHPRSPMQSGTTQSNEGTLALTIDNVDTTRQNMLNFTDDRGQLMGVSPDLVLVPAELQRTAETIFSSKAQYEPGSANFTVNLFGGRMRVIMWNRLTDSNAWFMIDSRLMKQYLIWQERVAPAFEALPQVNPEVAQFSGRMRYGIGWTYWSWIFGQNPS